MSHNIYQRLNEVRKAVQYLQKDASVTGYRAITHDYVTSEVRPHLIENGIMVVPRQSSYELRDTGKTTKNGIPFTNYIGVYDFDFVNIDEPQDKVTVRIGAMSEDTADKGAGGAISYAMKYAFLKLFNIETGDSEESRYEQKPDYITADQVVEIEDMIKEMGVDEEKFLKLGKAKSVDKLLSSQYKNAVAWLKQAGDNGNN
jgi:hypothetical protein